MKSIRMAFLTCLFSSLLIATTYGQWVQTNGPYGGYINCFARVGTNLFVGTWDAGVFLSTNNGTSWAAANTGLTNLIITSLSCRGTYLFAGTYGSPGLFLSTNNGTSWTAANSGMTYQIVNALAMNDTTLFAGTSGGGVFRSTDNGSSWAAANTGLTNLNILSLATRGTDLFAGTSGSGMFMSTDNGSSWAPANTGMSTEWVYALASNDTSLFAGTATGMFLSTNSGVGWVAINTGLTPGNVRALAVIDTNLFAGIYGVCRSTNSGTSWTDAGLNDLRVTAFLADGTNLFSGTQYGGVFLSTDQGLSWTAVNNGVTSIWARSLASSSDGSGKVFAATVGGGVFSSTDNGVNWAEVNNGLTNLHAYSLHATSVGLFVGTGGSGVFRSTNDGSSWTRAITGPGIVYAFTMSRDTLFAATDGNGVYFSTNNGSNWVPANTGWLTAHVRCFAVAGTNLFVGDDGAGVFLSTDNGSSWTAVNAGLTNLHVYTLSAIGTNLFAGTFGGGVFLSTDNGASWAAANAGLTNNYIYGLADYEGALFAGTDGQGVFLTTNSGTSWIAANNGLRYESIRALADNGAFLFAGTLRRSVWSANVNSLIPPAAPSGLIVSDSSNALMTIKWRKNTETDFLRYRIYRSTSPNPATKVDSTAGGAASDTSKTFAGLVNGTRYYFRVTTVDSAGNQSGYSNEVSAVPVDILAPSVPQNLVVTDSSSTTITVKWRKNSESDILRYRVYRGTSANPTTKVDSTTSGAADTTKTFAGLTNGTRYYFRVTAVDSAGNESAYSNEVNAVPADRLAPITPSSLVVTDSSSTTITVKWRKNSAADFLRYWIYRNTTPNPTTKVDSTAGGAADTSKTFTGLTNGTRYYLRVTAVDSTGNESGYSNEVNAAPNVPSSVDDLLNQIPTDFSLAQNYPNPFNPNTVIRYGLPVRSHVKIEIFNVLGESVALLADMEQEARYHEITWEGGGASGLYLYRFEAVAVGDANRKFVEVKKMLLVK